MTCPCFVPGEEAGAIFDVPASEYPIEILKVGIGWGSQFGGSPQVIEQAIKIYGAGLPNPGAPIFSLAGPQLTDGVINEFDLEPLPGEIMIAGGPFTVTLEFLNQNANDFFAPTVVHDGNGCQPAKNVVKAIPGGWNDACLLGVTGDWVFYVKYRSCAGTPVTVYNGLPNLPLGQATLNESGGTLTVSNIGSSGQDGVSIDLGRSRGRWRSLGRSGSPDPAADRRGSGSGSPGQRGWFRTIARHRVLR